MKMKNTIALALLALGTTALVASAQDNNDGPPPGGPGGQGGQGMNGRRPPMPAIISALDTNHDGIIDSNEIANASAALKTLDKNGDGKLTRAEYMGPRPQRPNGQNGDGKNGGRNPGGDDNSMPAGPPPGDGDGNMPPAGPPPGGN